MAPTDHDHRTPFDRESESGFDDADLTQEFWGESRGWQPNRGHQGVATATHRDDTTGAIRAIRDSMAAFRPRRVDLRDATGQVRRTRAHGGGRRPDDVVRAERRAEASIGDLAAGHHDDPFLDDYFLDESFVADPFLDDAFGATRDVPATFAGPDEQDRELVPLSAREPARTRVGLGGVDPLLARFGAMALVGVLLVPVALALRPSDPTPDGVRIESPAPTAAAAGAPDASAGDAPQPQPATTPDEPAASAAPDAAPAADAQASADVAAAPAEQAVTADEPVAPAEQAVTADEPVAPADQSGSTDTSSSAGVQAEAEPVADTRDAAPQGTADGAINDAATVDEPAERVVPSCPQTYTAGAGDSWYRIADAAGVSPGAVMAENRATGDTVILPGDEICLPADATVPSPPPTPEPDTTAAPTTTGAPATTAAPTTTDAPAPPASVAEVKAIIRATWPEEEHETALRIAERESSFNPRADNNWCCYGVFQIYFTVHQSWLDDFGVYQASDLFDAEKSIAAAYFLYEQAGGWGPWGF